VRQLGLGRFLEEKLLKAGELEPHQGMGAAQDDRLVTGLHERTRQDFRAQGDRLPLLDFQAVIHQQIGPARDHFVLQSSRSSVPRDKCRSPEKSLSHRPRHCNMGRGALSE
jgi:hypothetical protein